MSTLADRLEQVLAELESIWQPFAHPTVDWTTDPGLDALVAARDRSLAEAAPLVEELNATWKTWEDTRPGDQEKARVLSVRNRIVNLALEAGRLETSIENNVRRRIDELRRKAADSDRRSRAARAYGAMSLR